MQTSSSIQEPGSYLSILHHPLRLGSTVLGPVMWAHLGPDIGSARDPDAELHVWLCAPLDVVAGVNGPAFGAAGGGELGHVAAEAWESLSAALDDVAVQLAGDGLGRVFRARAAGVGEVVLALRGIVDQEFERLARGCRDGGSVDA